MHGKTFLPGILAAALSAVACSDGALAPDEGLLSVENARLLATEFDALGTSILHVDLGFGPHLSATPSGEVRASAAPVHVTFTRTRACPRGGSVTVSGTTTGEADRETRTLTTTTTATKTQSACAFGTRGGGTLTVNGDPGIALTANRKIVNGAPSGVQTTTQKGAFTWASSDGRSGACTVDLTSAFDPAARTHTVSGTICNRTVNVTRQRP